MDTDLRSILFEHRFWLQILGDHARFIYNALSPAENEEIDSAQHFIQVFDDLLQRARQGVPVLELTRDVRRYAENFRQFKLELIEKKLVSDLVLWLPPSFINHMVNEIEKYLEIIHFFLREEELPEEMVIEQHLLWLLDAKGHAGAINDNLNLVEQGLKEESQDFTENFDDLYDKVIEIAGYMRTSLDDFPALERFNFEAENEIEEFMFFLEKTLDLELANKVLGTLTPLLLDHMLREECYYLTKLAQLTSVRRPTCNPERPRIQERIDRNS
ncbi:MAG: DUF2935 domain-containing protein [Firmicutes bacterium]|nr:DUF2935 domain-containing protein [Bacillota bacterium]